MPRFFSCTLLLVLLGVTQQALLACRHCSGGSSRHQEVMRGLPSFDAPWVRQDDTDGRLENDMELYDQFQSENVVVGNNLDKDTNGTEQVAGNEKTVAEPNKKEGNLLTGEAMKALQEVSQQGPVKVELTEKITQTLPGNKTKEVLVNEKEEKLSSGETIKEVSLTRKNITDKDLNITNIEEETFVAQKVAKGASQSVKEEEKSTEKVVSVEKEEKVLGTVVPSVEKVVPLGGEQGVKKGQGENISKKIVQSIKQEEDKVVQLRKEIEGVVEKDTETKGNVTEAAPVGELKKGESLGREMFSPVPGEGEWERNTLKKDIATVEKVTDKNGFNITEEKVVETVAPSTEEKEKKSVPLPKGGAENISSVLKVNTTEGNALEKAPVVPEVSSIVWPVNETVDSVPKGEEKSNNNTMVKREIVTEEKVTDKDGSVVTKEKVVENVAPSAQGKDEKVLPVLKGEGVVGKIPRIVTENGTEGNISEKAAVVEGFEKIDPFTNEMIASAPVGEGINKTMAKKEITEEKKVSEKGGFVTKEEMVVENETKSNVSEKVPVAPELNSIVPAVNESVHFVPRGEENGNKTMAKIVTQEKLTAKNASIIREEKAEKAAPSVKEKEEKVIVIPKQEGRVVEKIVPVVKENATKENVRENVPLVQVITCVAPPVNEMVGAVPKEEKENKTTVAMEKVTNKEEKFVEKAAPSAMEKGEKVVPVLKGEVGNKAHIVTENIIAGNVSEKIPVVHEGQSVVWPVNETVSSAPNGGEKENKTLEEREIVTEKKVTDKDGYVIKEETVEKVASSVKEKEEKEVPMKEESLMKEI